MLRFLPFLIELFLLVFCLIDCIQTDESDVRNLGKVWWILLILFIPVIGPVAWLVAGRPLRGERRAISWPSTKTSGFPEYERPSSQRRPLAPDDDPEFLAQMRRSNAEQEDLLRKWEDDLRRREQDLRKNQQPGDGEKPTAPES
jgi:hypothetical protein